MNVCPFVVFNRAGDIKEESFPFRWWLALAVQLKDNLAFDASLVCQTEISSTPLDFFQSIFFLSDQDFYDVLWFQIF